MIKGKILLLVFVLSGIVFWGIIIALYQSELSYYQSKKKELTEGRDKVVEIYSLSQFINFIRSHDKYVSILFYSLSDSTIHYHQAVNKLRNSGKLSFFLLLDELSHQIDNYSLLFPTPKARDKYIKEMMITLNKKMIQQLRNDINTSVALPKKVNVYDIAHVIEPIWNDQVGKDYIKTELIRRWLRQTYSSSSDFPPFFGLYDIGDQYIHLAGVGMHPKTGKYYMLIILSDELPLSIWAHFREHGMYKDLFARLILNPNILN